MEENNFNCYIHEKNENVAVIELPSSVLGGNEALNFTSLLNDYSQKNVKYIIIDLKKVELINSSGLGMLVNGLSTMRKHNITLFLAFLPQKVTNLLKMTHLNEVFKIYNSVEDALIQCI